MEKLCLNEVMSSIGGKILKKGRVSQFTGIVTDTRKIENGDIFIALKGERYNANDFAIEASKKGACLLILDELHIELEILNDETTVILVENTYKALRDLAEFYRTKLDIKIVAITGSTGKTSTKDLVAAALSYKYKVFKTEGNFNNEIGLPLMVFKLDKNYDIAVLEMGMSGFNEIHNLAKIAKPDIAIMTNVGVSHLENLKTRENILKAKMEITDFFDENKCLIVNNDNDLLRKIEDENYKIVRVGESNDSNILAYKINLGNNFIEFNIKDKDFSEKFKLNLLGKHNVSNSLLAIAVAKELGLTYEEIKLGFKNIKTTSMRMEIVSKNNINIIKDCYNASPDSMKAAIDVISAMDGRKIAILGDMNELGDDSYNMHKDIGVYAKCKNIDIILTYGKYSKAYKEGFLEDSYVFEDREELIQYIIEEIDDGDNILVKASRTEKYEIIADKLINLQR
ncbi:MAG: UDP-N-acetylmuramoyl-tripeptide--D-alanyl-D-alanine ligase [Clostridiaceae bacterium]